MSAYGADYQPFHRAIIARPTDSLPRLIAADWLAERGESAGEAALRGPVPVKAMASEVGSGFGFGFGLGLGSGSGFGYGYGEDVEKPKRILKGKPMPEVGKRQLIVTGPWNMVFVGDVVAQTGPFSFRLANASMIRNSGGGVEAWPALCEDKGRSRMETVKWGEITVGPEFGPCKEWVGELP